MSDQQTVKTIQAIVAQLVQLQARCDALDAAVCLLATRAGIPQERIAAGIDKATARSHQKRLECIEDFDPGTAAKLDRRESGGDLAV